MALRLPFSATAAAVIAALLVVVALLPPTAAEAAETVRFAIYKDGDSIGEEVYTFDQGPDGQLTVDVTARTDVQVLFLKFRYRHQRTEVWRDGVLQSMTATTDDDGTPHSIALAREGNAWRVQADTIQREERGDVLPLTLWTPKVLETSRVLSVIDAEPWDVTVQNLGPVSLGGQEATQWRMTGGVTRDLWYSPGGHLLQVQFERQGYKITYVRQ